MGTKKSAWMVPAQPETWPLQEQQVKRFKRNSKELDQNGIKEEKEETCSSGHITRWMEEEEVWDLRTEQGENVQISQ